MIPCEKYQYNVASLGFLHIINLPQNLMTPKFLLSDQWLFLVLGTLVWRLTFRTVYRIHIYNYKNNVPFLSFHMCLKYFFWPEYNTHHKFLSLSMHTVVSLLLSNSSDCIILLTCPIVLLTIDLKMLGRTCLSIFISSLICLIRKK